jgi:hypothetical protein
LLLFYNIFSDYAYQVNDKTSIKKVKLKELCTFFDFVNNVFFWKTDDRIKEEYISSAFNQLKFKTDYTGIISEFEQRLLHVIT